MFQVEYLTIKAGSWTVLDRKNQTIRSGKWKWSDIDQLFNIPQLSSKDIDFHLGQIKEYDSVQLKEPCQESLGACGGQESLQDV